MMELIIVLLVVVFCVAIGICIGKHIENQELKWYARTKMMERGIADPKLMGEIQKARDAAIELMKHFEK